MDNNNMNVQKQLAKLVMLEKLQGRKHYQLLCDLFNQYEIMAKPAMIREYTKLLKHSKVIAKPHKVNGQEIAENVPYSKEGVAVCTKVLDYLKHSNRTFFFDWLPYMRKSIPVGYIPKFKKWIDWKIMCERTKPSLPKSPHDIFHGLNDEKAWDIGLISYY